MLATCAPCLLNIKNSLAVRHSVCASGRQTTLGASGCFGGSSQALRRFCDATHPLTPGSVVLCNTSSVVSRKKETSSFIIITFSSLPRFHISFFILLRQHFDSRSSCFMPSEVTPICALLEHKLIALRDTAHLVQCYLGCLSVTFFFFFVCPSGGGHALTSFLLLCS